MRIAARPQDVDAAWLTDALREAGVLKSGRVASVRHEPVGAGMLGDSARFTLTYEGDAEGCPGSLIGKFASPDERSRQLGARNGLYLSEIQFYREFAATVNARLARCYASEIYPDTAMFTLLLEDLAPARPVDQIDGCSPQDAAKVIEQAAGFHAPFWNDARLWDRPWLARRTEHLKSMAAMFVQSLDPFEARFGDVLDRRSIDVCRRFGVSAASFFERPNANFTIKHTDLRLDNLLFDVCGSKDVAILDWQSVAIGGGALDIAFFMGTSLEIEDRRAHEGELVRLYLDALHRQGVRDYSWDQCWSDYRFQTFQAICTVVVASAHTKRTERSDGVFTAMARRATAMMDDLKSLSMA